MTIINMSGGKPAKPIVVEAVEETPSTLPHTFLPREGVDYLSSVTVGKDPNLTAGNIKQGVSIFGVEGTLASGGGGNLADYEIPWRCYSLPFIPLVEFEGERPTGGNAPVYCSNYYVSATLGDTTTGDVHVKPYPRLNMYAGPYSATPMQVDIAQGTHTSLAVGTLYESGTRSNLAADVRTSIGQLFPGTNNTELPFTGTAIPVAFCEGTGSNGGIGWETQPEPISITGVLGVSGASASKTTMTVNIPSDISMLCYCRGTTADRLFMGLAIIDLAFDMGEYI